MNADKIKSLLKQIDNTAVFTAGDSPYLHSVTAVDDVVGDPEHEVLYINWHDDGGQEYSLRFTEQGLDEAKISGNQITLNDHEGDEVLICLYALEPDLIMEDWE